LGIGLPAKNQTLRETRSIQFSFSLNEPAAASDFLCIVDEYRLQKFAYLLCRCWHKGILSLNIGSTTILPDFALFSFLDAYVVPKNKLFLY